MTEEIGITEVMALIAVIIMTGEMITIVGTIAEVLTEGTTMTDGTIVEAMKEGITMTDETIVEAMTAEDTIVGMAVTIVGIIMIAEEVVIAMIVDQMNVMVSQHK